MHRGCLELFVGGLVSGFWYVRVVYVWVYGWVCFDCVFFRFWGWLFVTVFAFGNFVCCLVILVSCCFVVLGAVTCFACLYFGDFGFVTLQVLDLPLFVFGFCCS